MRLKTMLILVLIVLFCILLAQNTQVVSIKLLFWELSMSRIVLLILTGLIGFFLGYIVRKWK